jgi:small subunit ribosomal protein S1
LTWAVLTDFIHITDLSWGRINHPEEIVQLDQKINVVILDFDDTKNGLL